MKKTMLVLGVLFSVLFSSLALIGATGGMLSEATLSPGKPLDRMEAIRGLGSRMQSSLALWFFGCSRRGFFGSTEK
jgi:hypothetical protein